jgi:uncharacterized protein (DUF885 family)
MSVAARFFHRYLELSPEEATTLGCHDFDDRLSDVSEAGAGALVDLAEETLAAKAESIDDRHAQRIARWLVHSFRERNLHLANVELPLLEHLLLGYHATQVATDEERERWRARVSQLPAFLAAHEANLEVGLRAGMAFDRAILVNLVDHELSAIASSYDALGLGQVAGAFRKHRSFLESSIAPRASDAFAIGEDEYRRRLAVTLGIERSPDELIETGWEHLRAAQAELLARAGRAAKRTIDDLAGARRVVDELEDIRPETDADVVPLYRGLTDRALRHVEARQLFRVPRPFDLGMDPPPPGRERIGATNWPAPLLDRTKRAQFIVNPKRELHSIPRAANLAVHEGVPGHSLQSFVWQRTFDASRSPIRFLMVADDAAFARSWFGAMLNVEGYAVYAEQRMLETGYFDDREAVFTLWSHAIRAARVILDVAIHTGRMTKAEAVDLLEREACYRRDWAEDEVLRYTRIPLQAITYLLGRLEIEALRRELGLPDLEFHDRFFAFGPLPPSDIRAELGR